MRFRLVVDGDARSIEVDRSKQAILVRVDGAEYRCQARRMDDGVAVRLDSTWRRLRFEGRHAISPDAVHVISVTDIEAEPSEPSSRAKSRGARLLKVRAPMAGRVIRVVAETGKPVRRGETLLVLEAMKMQNEIPAPRDGFLQEVRVVEGESVSVDQVVAVLENR